MFKVTNVKNKLCFSAVMISATMHVNISSCVHFVMKGVTSGISETPVMLPVPFSCLTMVLLYFLLLLCLFGVSSVLCVICEWKRTSVVMLFMYNL